MFAGAGEKVDADNLALKMSFLRRRGVPKQWRLYYTALRGANWRLEAANTGGKLRTAGEHCSKFDNAHRRFGFSELVDALANWRPEVFPSSRIYRARFWD